MSRNKIMVKLGMANGGMICPTGPPQTTPVYVDLGRLPPGDYTVTVERAWVGEPPFAPPSRWIALDNAPFTVAENLAKFPAYVRLDYSGHWWDPDDPGWGLFIWQGQNDRLLAAWFTYDADRKPVWYVTQPNGNFHWGTFAMTYLGPLYQTSRAPGSLTPPPNPTTATIVGSARLVFDDYGTNDEGKFIYTFTGGTTQTRNIRRFKP